MTIKTMKLPKTSIRADFMPETANEKERTVEVIFSTGARVRRDSFFDGPFFEELGMDPSEVRMDRFENGASVLNSHNRFDLDAVIGVIDSARLEDGQGIAVVRFSKREEVAGIFQDVMDGVVRNVSVGYRLHKMEKVGEENDIPIFRATDWEPQELSFVSIPADPHSQVRSEDSSYSCQIITRESEDMASKVTTTPTPTPAPVVEPTRAEPAVDLNKIRSEAIEAERTRCTDIRSACSKGKMDADFSERMISEGKDINEVRSLILDAQAEDDDKTRTESTNISVGDDITRSSACAGIEGALNNRVDRSEPLDDNSKRFAHMTLLDLARAALEASGNNCRLMARSEIAQNALRTPNGLIRSAGYHSTSDFPLILENVLNKRMQRGYERAPQTWRPFTNMTTVSDFKEVSRPHLGEFTDLALIPEGGEYKHGTISERAEKYAIKKYGRLIAVTWEMLINDDLSAFNRITGAMGRKVADLESDIVWAILTANTQVMAETGSTLFNAAHNNLNSGGAGVFSETALAAVREEMRLHKDLGGTAPLNIFPAHAFVPASREVEAKKILTGITPRQSADVNVFGQDSGFSLTMAVEPRLDAVGTKPWFVTADASSLEMIEAAQLAGNETPQLFSREGFDVDGIEWKIRYHFNAHALDYRGMQRNDGV